MTGRIALVRATHLNDYIKVLRDFGAPVDRDLACSQLPADIEEVPDMFVSIPLAMEWIAKTGRDLEPMELGFLGAQNASLSSLGPAQQTAIMTGQTGLKRLEVLIAISRSEDSSLEMSVCLEGGDIRVICKMAGLENHPFICFAEWLNLQGVISVVRSVAGPTWCPSEMCFVSPSKPPYAVLASFPNTRILVGQTQSSIVVARTDIARSSDDADTSIQDIPHISTAEMEAKRQTDDWEFIHLLRQFVTPYLSDRRPDVAFAAEMAGMSTRTLQRRLKQCGSSYSQILQEARFSLARTRLNDPDLKVIDVAAMSGYESPQHFTRAFRQFTGVTPSEYRQLLTHEPFPLRRYR